MNERIKKKKWKQKRQKAFEKLSRVAELAKTDEKYEETFWHENFVFHVKYGGGFEMKGEVIPEFLKKKFIIAGIDLANKCDITGGVKHGLEKRD